MRSLPTIAVLWTVLALSASAAQAMTVVDAPVEVVLAEADLAVHATVISTSFEPAPGAGVRVRTRHLLRVWEVLASPGDGRDVGRWIDVVLPGGVVNGLQTTVPGVPRLSPGDEVILLLGDTPWGYQPIGYALGTFLVARDGSVVPTWGPHTTRARRAAQALLLEPWLEMLRSASP